MAFLNQIFLIAPLLLPSVGLTLGIILYWVFSKPWLIFSVLPVGLGVLKIAKDQRNSIFLWVFLALLCGITVSYKQQRNFLRTHRVLTEKLISVRGYIVDIEKKNEDTFPYMITVALDSYTGDNQTWHSISGRIKIRTCHYKRCITGDFLEIYDIKGQSAEGEFLHYLMKENINAYFFTGYVHHTLLSRPYFSLMRFLYKKRKQLEKIFELHAGEMTTFYFNMLFLGKKSKDKKLVTTNDYFKNWGISHMTARSGMHMTMVSLLCYSIMHLFPISFLYKHIMLAVIIILYGLFSYPTVSFIRSFLTTGCIVAYHCMYTRSNFLHVTFLVYIFQLLYNPLCLFFLDFQLSFLLTLGIGFFSKKYFYKTLI